MVGTPSPQTISTKQLELAQRAERYPHEALSTLAHFIDLDWLREAYRRTRKDGAPGVDGQVAAEYEADLEANLSSLLDRFKSGLYRVPRGNQENGSIESPHGHLKSAIRDALLLRGTRHFEELTEYRRFIDEITSRKNARNAKRIEAERAHLQPLPPSRTTDYEDVPVYVTSWGAWMC